MSWGLKLELAEQFADLEQQVLALPRQLAHRLQLSFALQHWRCRLLVLACFQYQHFCLLFRQQLQLRR